MIDNRKVGKMEVNNNMILLDIYLRVPDEPIRAMELVFFSFFLIWFQVCNHTDCLTCQSILARHT